jgi:hypothetical protein
MQTLVWIHLRQNSNRKIQIRVEHMVGNEQEDPLNIIIRSFNVRWFQGWEATPEEQRIKFVNIAKNNEGSS